jgi:hypothetical protein
MSTPLWAKQAYSVQQTNVLPTYTTYAFTTSLITVAPASVPFGALPPVSVREGLLINDPDSGRQARVDQSFTVVLSLIEGGFLATSSIADLYEIGETPSEAVSRYFASLVDELLWFQNGKREFSHHLQQVEETLHFYLHLV